MTTPFSQTKLFLSTDTSWRSHLVWIAGSVLLAAWLMWFFLSSVTVYEVSRRARLEVRQAPHHIASSLARKVVQTHIEIGQSVRQGDPLIELDASSEVLRLREEQARLDAIPDQIRSLEREIVAREEAKAGDKRSAEAAAEVASFRSRETQTSVDLAKDTERRYANLSASGSVSTLDHLKATAEAQRLTASQQASLAELRRIQSDAETRASQHQAEIEGLRRNVVTLQGELARTENAVARLKVDIERHIIRSPVDGTIGDALPLYTGAYVPDGQRVVTVVPAGELMVVAEFSPSLTLGRVRPGQKARLRLDGFPWAQFGTLETHVTRVASEIRDAVVRVELTPDRSESSAIKTQHGLTGSIEVEVESVSPANLVLRAAGLLLSNQAKAATSESAAR